MARLDILFRICRKFATIDLHPDAIPDRVMSNIDEHLIRRFGAAVNEGAEDFMTPRDDVVHLDTTLVLDPDDALFESTPGLIRTLYDPACGTGGFLTDAMNHVADHGSGFHVPPALIPHGQELEPETSNKKPPERDERVQLIDATDLWTSVKNKGNKRRLISDDQIRQITDVYAAAETGGISRLLDYRTFGYRRIRVLRPLRMRLHLDVESPDRLKAEKAWGKLSEVQQTVWETALAPHPGQVYPFAWAETFAAEIASASPAIGKVGKPVIKALINAFGKRDPGRAPNPGHRGTWRRAPRGMRETAERVSRATDVLGSRSYERGP